MHLKQAGMEPCIMHECEEKCPCWVCWWLWALEEQPTACVWHGSVTQCTASHREMLGEGTSSCSEGAGPLPSPGTEPSSADTGSHHAREVLWIRKDTENTIEYSELGGTSQGSSKSSFWTGHPNNPTPCLRALSKFSWSSGLGLGPFPGWKTFS